MKTSIIRILLLTGLSVAFPRTGLAQATDASKEIENVLSVYIAAIAERDAVAMREVLVEQLVTMHTETRAGKKSARIQFKDTAEDQSILPPEGNDDMAGFRVSSVRTEFSEPNATTAFASFTISRPMTETEVEQMRALLDPQTFADVGAEIPPDYEAGRLRIQKWVSEERFEISAFAMLGLQEGRWKIVCVSIHW